MLQCILAQVELHEVRQAAEGLLVYAYQLIARQVDLLQIQQIHAQEAFALQHLQAVATEIEHLRARIHALGQHRELLAAALDCLLAALPFADAHLGRTGQHRLEQLEWQQEQEQWQLEGECLQWAWHYVNSLFPFGGYRVCLAVYIFLSLSLFDS